MIGWGTWTANYIDFIGYILRMNLFKAGLKNKK